MNDVLMQDEKTMTDLGGGQWLVNGKVMKECGGVVIITIYLPGRILKGEFAVDSVGFNCLKGSNYGDYFRELTGSIFEKANMKPVHCFQYKIDYARGLKDC